MLKLKFLILLIFFIQVFSNFLDILEEDMDGLYKNKCTISNDKPLIIKDSAQCVERNSFLPKEDNDSKCCFLSGSLDPLFPFQKLYGENWKKIVAQKNGFDLNISEEEIRKKLNLNIKEIKECQYFKKGSKTALLYAFSLSTMDGIAKYDCGEGQKIFKGKEFHPLSREEILDKQLIESFFVTFTEKECLKRGTKLSDDNYQICWCELIQLSSESFNEKKCHPFRTSTFQERLKKEMNRFQKYGSKVEKKCTCSNNKSKTSKGYYNSITGEVKVELNK